MSVPEPLLRDGQPPLVIGHRGASGSAPENTMAAFAGAWSAPTRWIETDVQPSRDHVPVLIHDSRVDRTTDGTGAVRDLTFAALQRLNAGNGRGDEFADARIPALAELLAEWPADELLLLEIKGRHTRADLQRVLDVVDAADAAERVLLQSFGVGVLRTLRTMRPNEPLGLLAERIHADPVALCRELGAVTYNPGIAELRGAPALVDTLHRADIAIIVWTANTVDDWAFLTGLGVDGIFTDRPAELAAWQSENL